VAKGSHRGVCARIRDPSACGRNRDTLGSLSWSLRAVGALPEELDHRWGDLR
jgi:hypothetical protein